MAQRAKVQGGTRGPEAQKLREIPKTGWRDILLRVKEAQKKDNLSIISAGVAFYALLAIFPAIASAVSIFGLVADPAQLQQQLSNLSGFLPHEAHQLIEQQLSRIVKSSAGALGVGVVGGILFSLWSSAKAMRAVIIALDVVYEEEDERGFFKLHGLAILLTLGSIVFTLVALGLILALPAILRSIGLPGFVQTIILNIGRWFLLGLMIIFALGVLYRYGPNRDHPRRQWASIGAVVATVLWIGASFLFSYFVSNFANYNKIYGSMGAIIILLMWFFLTAYAVLIGAELNTAIERQTRRDTTPGEPEPMG